MTRTSHSVPAVQRGTFQKILGAALLTAAAFAAPAQAGVITFDGAPDYVPGMVFGGDAWMESGYTIGFFANLPGDGVGSLVGQMYDGDQSSCDTSSQICPANTSGVYFGALNDTYMDMMFTSGVGFKIKSFDASFIGSSASLGSYPNPVGLVRLLGITATGASMTQDFWFDNSAQTKNFQLHTFNTSGLFANTVMKEVLVYGFACNTGGSCQAFATDRGQFAIDNITTSDVPEPATAAIVGLGLLGVAAARRRRQTKA
jgi:hypothetical protein